MARSRRVTVSLYDGEDREVEVRALYYPGAPAYFDRSWGNWLPADDADVDVISLRAVDDGADVDEVARRVSEIEEAVVMRAVDCADDDADARYEAERDRRAER